MLKEIFKNIEGKEWDWFGKDKSKFSIREDEIVFRGCLVYAIQHLFGNHSWCFAVWGEECYKHFPLAAVILESEGQAPALKYILDTMIKKAV